jgi:hypothetical protein
MRRATPPRGQIVEERGYAGTQTVMFEVTHTDSDGTATEFRGTGQDSFESVTDNPGCPGSVYVKYELSGIRR